MRAHDRADRVVRLGRRAHPVAHRLVGGVAEGPRTAGHGDDRRAHRPHIKNVELLTPDVLLPHVDGALQARQRARRRRGDPVLAGAGLGDHPGLAHPVRQEDLADPIVDLMGAGMVEVLPLQVNLGPADQLREPPRMIERRRPADIIRQVIVQLLPEARILFDPFIRLGEPIEGIDQGLRDEPTAEGAEASQGVGQGPGLVGRGGHARGGPRSCRLRRRGVMSPFSRPVARMVKACWVRADPGLRGATLRVHWLGSSSSRRSRSRSKNCV